MINLKKSWKWDSWQGRGLGPGRDQHSQVILPKGMDSCWTRSVKKGAWSELVQLEGPAWRL